MMCWMADQHTMPIPHPCTGSAAEAWGAGVPKCYWQRSYIWKEGSAWKADSKLICIRLHGWHALMLDCLPCVLGSLQGAGQGGCCYQLAHDCLTTIQPLQQLVVKEAGDCFTVKDVCQSFVVIVLTLSNACLQKQLTHGPKKTAELGKFIEHLATSSSFEICIFALSRRAIPLDQREKKWVTLSRAWHSFNADSLQDRQHRTRTSHSRVMQIWRLPDEMRLCRNNSVCGCPTAVLSAKRC